MRFWQWFSYTYYPWHGTVDWGAVQIQVYNTNTLQWSGWTNLMTVSQATPVWSPAQFDLSAHAGRRVRLGFYHNDGAENPGARGNWQSWGWYIDEITIEKRPVLVFSGQEGFESGWNGWYAEMGIWEVGSPTNGPGRAALGSNAVGTVINGFYPACTSSRLVSPTIDLPAVQAGEEVVL